MKTYDVIIVGSGPSGSFVANELTQQGFDCLILEAGYFFTRESFPTNYSDGTARLFWSGGMELNNRGNIGFLRPKCVGGGSIVNQALLDRFDQNAFKSWRNTSGIDFFNKDHMDPLYDRVEDKINLETIPEQNRNKNADIFREGCKSNNYNYHDLSRAQRDCRYEDGNDCIECLYGCRIDSKQSMPVTVLNEAFENGLELISGFEVKRIREIDGHVRVIGEQNQGPVRSFRAGRVVLAAGAIGNTKILLQSGYGESHPQLGEDFYTHPQTMVFGVFDEPVRAFEEGFQSVASSDPSFRKQGFKLENVFATPGDLALLMPGIGRRLHRKMDRLNHLACIEVAVRDTNPGTIQLDSNGEVVIRKTLNREDKKRRQRGLKAIRNILESAGCKNIIEGDPSFGLHLMGGCSIGTNPSTSLVSPDYNLHGSDNVFVADSSIFPNAPGINPALTIMALSIHASRSIEESI